MFHPQLTLPLGNAASSSFDSYLAGKANANAASSVQAFCAEEFAEQQLFLWGESAVGKTHLLSAACQKLAARGLQVAYLTGELANSPDALASIEHLDLLCLDDLQDLSVTSEEALFHCINRCRDSGTRLLFASTLPIDDLPFTLPDLKTRLSWGAVFHLQPLSDDELPAVVTQLLHLRGLDVNDDVVDYILRRYPRNMHALRGLIDSLDQASMVEKRRVTIPLVRGLNRTSDAEETVALNDEPTAIKHVVFDFGNVMVRWSPLEIIRLTFGANESSQEFANSVFQGEIWSDINKGLLTEDEAKLRFADEYEWTEQDCDRFFYYVKHTQLVLHGSVELLSQLKAAGYGVYALTDNVAEVIEHLKKHYTFWELFDGTTVSADLGKLKPHAEVFRAMLLQNEIDAAETVFIDDMPYNVAGALSMGMAAIQFENAAQCEQALRDLGLRF